MPPPEELLSPPPTATPAPIPGIPEKITVERFEVVGSTVFSTAELDQVLAGFINRPLSFTELFQARSAVTQLYIDRGYITSGALIPPQTLQGGVVKIQVVEGSLEAINVTGTRRLQPSYVRDRLPTSIPLNQKRLLEALQLLQINPLIQNLSAELAAGTRPGMSVLEVQVTEAKSFNTQLVADNGRSPSVGSFRRRLQLNEANLLGLGDGLNLAYTNTDGSNSLDASYGLPINSYNGNVNFSYGTTGSSVIEEPFAEVFNIDGNSRYYELTLRQPIFQTPTQEFTLGLTAARRESDISAALRESNNSEDFRKFSLPSCRQELMNRDAPVSQHYNSFKNGQVATAEKSSLPDRNLVSVSVPLMPQSTKRPLIAAFLLGGDRHSGYVSLLPKLCY